jgi:hypothetical protein
MLDNLLFLAILAAIFYITYRIDKIETGLNETQKGLKVIATRLEQLITMVTHNKDINILPNGPEPEGRIGKQEENTI